MAINLELLHAGRLLRRHPAFSLVAILTLGVGIGAATLVFSLVRTALLRELPFTEPDRLVWIYNARTERDRAPFSIPDLEDYRRDARSLAGLAVFTNWTANLTGIGAAERLEGTRVSGNFFELLGAIPLLGRTVRSSDEEGDMRVAVLTHGLWQRRFGGDPRIVGRTVSLNGAAYLVIGVMPRGFLFPFREAQLAVPTTLSSDARRTDRGANFLRVVARLAPGVSLRQAKSELDAIAHRLQRLYPDEDSRKTGVNLYPLHAEIVRDYRQILWTLFAAVVVLLAVACGNLANLMLVRAVGRTSELSLRMSLGASRRRIGLQLAMEAAMLAALGGVAGIVLARMGLAAWQAFGPASFPLMEEIALDSRVLAFALACAAVATIICGVVPARAVSRDLLAGLRDASRSMTGTRRHHAARRVFVALQVAGSVVLLVCMALVARGFARLERVDAGFLADHALSLQLSLPPRTYGDRESVGRFYEALRMRLASVAGIRHLGAVSLLPLSGLLSTMDVAFPDRPAPPPDEVPQAHFRITTPGYFAAAGIPMYAGREFTDDDLSAGHLVAIVSRTFAERHWPNQPALGRQVQIVQAKASPPLEVVGVVGDVKQFSLDGPTTADLYVPIHQMPASQAPFVAGRMGWIIRTHGDPHLLIEPVRQAVHAVDVDVASSTVRTLDEVLASSLGARRVNVWLLEAFGQVAIVLCAMGVYAVASFSARARRRELAIRAALGATRRELSASILGKELQPVALGLGLGYVVALLVAPRLGPLLFATSPVDAPTYLLVGLGVLAVTGLATYLPSWRAGASDPAELLRA